MTNLNIELSFETLLNMCAISEEGLEELFSITAQHCLINSTEAVYWLFDAINWIHAGLPEDEAIKNMQEMLK